MAMFRDAWDLQAQGVDDRVTQPRKNLHAITNQIDHLVDRITQTEVSAVVAAYERRLRGLEEGKLVIEERISDAERTKPQNFDVTVRTAVEFLENPCRLWKSEHVKDKRLVAKLMFAGRVAYSRSEGFRTPEFSQPLKWLGDTTDAIFEMASPNRDFFEPTA